MTLASGNLDRLSFISAHVGSGGDPAKSDSNSSMDY